MEGYMKRDLEKTRAALIDAAEKLMVECDDLDKVTARAITQKAGVNLAMINYCFGSREELLYEVYSKIHRSALKLDPSLGEIMTGGLSPKEKLVEAHYRTMKLMLSYFKYCKALTKYTLVTRKIGDKRSSLQFITEHFGGRRSEGECRLIAFELSSIHELAVLRHEEIRDVCGIDLMNDDVLKKFVCDNVERMLGD
ncbi:MAG: TetR/AcrR family transcriptional regulator [Ruminiclostridium sp.]|nr:TetR/AcrR family transcriptional regulator [Ruminiclostridium sp.]